MQKTKTDAYRETARGTQRVCERAPLVQPDMEEKRQGRAGHSRKDSG